MPLYEYQCCSCEKEFQVLIMKKDQESDTVCPDCGNKTLKRLISRVAYHIPEKARLASFDNNARRDDSFYKDSRNIGLSAKKMAERAGLDLGNGFEAKLDRLRSNPGEVLKDYE
jgi:putative FmdB family regulatory protein